MCTELTVRFNDVHDGVFFYYRYEDCRICHSTLPYDWIGRDVELSMVDGGNSRDYSPNSSDSWESMNNRRSRGNRRHRRTGGGRK